MKMLQTRQMASETVVYIGSFLKIILKKKIVYQGTDFPIDLIKKEAYTYMSLIINNYYIFFKTPQ